LKEDAECIYDFILRNFNDVEPKDIMILGRSIGSGPSIHLANWATKMGKQPGGIVIISPFKNIKSVVSDNYSFLSVFITE
jgi:hypothetical protein